MVGTWEPAVLISFDRHIASGTAVVVRSTSAWTFPLFRISSLPTSSKVLSSFTFLKNVRRSCECRGTVISWWNFQVIGGDSKFRTCIRRVARRGTTTSVHCTVSSINRETHSAKFFPSSFGFSFG